VVDDNLHKRHILKSLGKKWRARRGSLYKLYDKTKSREENIANPPNGLSRKQWASFIDYRNHPKTQVITLSYILIYFNTIVLMLNL